MIYDLIQESGRYMGLLPQLDEALKFLAEADPAALVPGRYILSDKVHYTVMEAELSAFSQTRWECHREYIDIQAALEPGESIGVWPAEKIEGWGPYSKEKDISFSDGREIGVTLPMNVGMFAVFFPADAHRACEKAGTEERIRKLVIKVAL